MTLQRYRVRYRFCPREEYIARMQGEAEEKVRMHQDIWHDHDGKQCAYYERVDQEQAKRLEAQA